MVLYTMTSAQYSTLGYTIVCMVSVGFLESKVYNLMASGVTSHILYQ